MYEDAVVLRWLMACLREGRRFPTGTTGLMIEERFSENVERAMIVLEKVCAGTMPEPDESILLYRVFFALGRVPAYPDIKKE